MFVEAFRVKDIEANEWEIKNAVRRFQEGNDIFLIYFKSHEDGRIEIIKDDQ